MEKWNCPDCGYKSSIEIDKCTSCGYKATEYDIASAADDTGRYLLEELSVSVDKLNVRGPSWLRISLALIIGVGIGTVIISIVKVFF